MQKKKTSFAESSSCDPSELSVIVTDNWMILRGSEVIYSGDCEGLKKTLAALGRAISADAIKEVEG